MDGHKYGRNFGPPPGSDGFDMLIFGRINGTSQPLCNITGRTIGPNGEQIELIIMPYEEMTSYGSVSIRQRR